MLYQLVPCAESSKLEELLCEPFWLPLEFLVFLMSLLWVTHVIFISWKVGKPFLYQVLRLNSRQIQHHAHNVEAALGAEFLSIPQLRRQDHASL
jgi:hypothetical protein